MPALFVFEASLKSPMLLLAGEALVIQRPRVASSLRAVHFTGRFVSKRLLYGVVSVTGHLVGFRVDGRVYLALAVPSPLRSAAASRRPVSRSIVMIVALLQVRPTSS